MTMVDTYSTHPKPYLATEDETTALAEKLDAETRACAEVVGKAWGLSVTTLHKQILALIFVVSFISFWLGFMIMDMFNR